MKRKDELSQLRKLDQEELEKRVSSTEQELMNLTFRHASGQLEQTAQFKMLRRRIGRIKTVQNELQSSV